MDSILLLDWNFPPLLCPYYFPNMPLVFPYVFPNISLLCHPYYFPNNSLSSSDFFPIISLLFPCNCPFFLLCLRAWITTSHCQKECAVQWYWWSGASRRFGGHDPPSGLRPAGILGSNPPNQKVCEIGKMLIQEAECAGPGLQPQRPLPSVAVSK